MSWPGGERRALRRNRLACCWRTLLRVTAENRHGAQVLQGKVAWP